MMEREKPKKDEGTGGNADDDNEREEGGKGGREKG